MRFVFTLTAVAAVLFSAAAAQAEKRVFIIANDSDAYGVDHCLSTGGQCGATVANAYCHSHDYAQALSFRKVDRDDITGAIPAGSGATCKGGNCDDFVAIECTR